MRRLVDRHSGILPLDTVESIWRVIISTFTYVQALFSVHADLSTGDAGCAIPPASISASRCRSCRTRAPPAWVRGPDSKGDLGLVPALPRPAPGVVERTEFDTAPKIIARLPSSTAPTIPPPPTFGLARGA
jgi:hypothetical protein